MVRATVIRGVEETNESLLKAHIPRESESRMAESAHELC